MTRFIRWSASCAGVAVLTLAAACEPERAPRPAPASQPPRIEPEQLVELAAETICGVLFRCCPSDEDLQRYFLPVSTRDPQGEAADLIARVPPNAALTADACPALMFDVFSRIAVGPWVDVWTADGMAFDADAARVCLSALEEAACGVSARDALLDSRCFGLAAPAGGDEQRSFVVRSASSGACHAVVDGFGGLFYGTCDPRSSFCCIPDEGGACGLSRMGALGTCKAVSLEGETCSWIDPTQLCATGNECVANGDDDVCAAPLTTPLSPGDPCWDPAQLRLLGDCEDSACDVLGDPAMCVPLLEDGDPCESGDRCGSGLCAAGVCRQDDWCGAP